MTLRSTIALSLALAASVGFAQNQQLGAFVGKPLPRFVMKDLSGKTLTNKDLKGKVVVLDFWASWCGPCKAAAPGMQELHQKLASKGLMVIGANCMEHGKTEPQIVAYIKSYAKTHGYAYKFTAINDGLAETLGVSSIPAFAIVDRKGIVRAVRTGIPPSGAKGVVEDFEPIVKKLLASR